MMFNMLQPTQHWKILSPHFLAGGTHSVNLKIWQPTLNCCAPLHNSRNLTQLHAASRT